MFFRETYPDGNMVFFLVAPYFPGPGRRGAREDPFDLVKMEASVIQRCPSRSCTFTGTLAAQDEKPSVTSTVPEPFVPLRSREMLRSWRTTKSAEGAIVPP